MNCVGCYICIYFFIQITKARPGLRIIGGQDANEEKYPYVVIIGYEFKIRDRVLLSLRCTGAVLAPTWALSAAHCFLGPKLGFFVQHSIKNHTWNPETMSKVISIIVHPAYRLQNDIALMKTEVISLKEYARFSALNPMAIIGHEVILFGFGLTNLTNVIDVTIELQRPLQMIEVVVIKCDENLDIRMKMRPGMCVARRCGHSAGICSGDSGGPTLHPSGIVAVNTKVLRSGSNFCRGLTKDNYNVGLLTPTGPYVDWVSYVIKKDTERPPDV